MIAPNISVVLMSTIPQMIVANPVTIRNSRFWVGCCFVGVCVGFLMAAGFALAALAPLRHGFTFGRLMNVLLGECFAIGLLLGIGGLWRLSLTMARAAIRLADDGIYFRLSANRHDPEVFFPIGKITRIVTKREVNVRYCWIFAEGDREISFSSYIFIRPKHIAAMIAKYTGKSLQEM